MGTRRALEAPDAGRADSAVGRVIPVVLAWVALLLACEGDGGPRPDAAEPIDSGEDAAPESGGEAGGPLADEGVIERSGSRLQVAWAENASGARSFGRWHDSQLETTCSFQMAEDTELRCLPEVAATLNGGGREFADVYCTRPAFVFPAGACEAPAPYVSVDASDFCHKQTRIHRLGERLGRYHVLFDTGECVPMRLRAGETAYGMGAAVPAASFVRADVAPHAVGDPGPLQVLLGQAEDGARYFAGWWNPAVRASCVFAPLSDGGPRCFSSAAFVPGEFLDATCTQKAASYLSACGEEPRHVLDPNPGVCPPTFSVKALGLRQETIYYQSRAGSCLQARPPGVRYYAIGAPVDASAFPRIDYQNEDSGGRLHRRFVVAAGSGRAQSASWFDSERGEVCVPTQIGGKLRCAPEAVGLEYYYVDGGCTEPLLRTTADTCPPSYAMEWERASCPERPYFMAVGARHTGILYAKVAYTDEDGVTTIDCGQTGPGPTDAFYRLTVVRDEELAELKLTQP